MDCVLIYLCKLNIRLGGADNNLKFSGADINSIVWT